ncbi:MAG: TauD/TfdA family dioxygenase [Alphaproteobacteria bacterium]|nr:TauD/TfdA family dioxygenase [Alphaproteobacteria bacterium]
MQLRQLHPHFVAEVSDLAAGRPLPSQTVRAIWEAIDRYAVLVLRNQQLDDERQLSFARHFGEIEAPRSARATTKRRLRPEISDISNLDENGRLRADDDPRRFDQLGNRLWHTDGSFRRVPAALSMLYAHKVPSSGGETEFADMRAAWDTLPDHIKAEVEHLVAVHDIAYSRGQIGFTQLLFGEREVLPAVPQRLVRLHPGSGRKTLYLAAHASHILARPISEGRLMLRDLIEFATQREFVYCHTWRPSDLVIWDNRCTMHRGRPFDEGQTRDLRRVTTRDTASTLDQVA